MHQNVLLDPDPGKESPMRPCLIFFVAILPLHWLASSSETNLLANPGFELGLEGWTTDHAAIRQASPPPHQGNNELQRLDLGWFYSNMTWTLKEGTLPLPPATRQITFGFYARRARGLNNDVIPSRFYRLQLQP